MDRSDNQNKLEALKTELKNKQDEYLLAKKTLLECATEEAAIELELGKAYKEWKENNDKT